MKWIGQLIYDQIARFRDDVYLEDISSGTIASGGNLGLDSNNKIVKQSDTGITDLHGAGVDGSNNQLLTDDGDGTVTSETYLTFVNNSNISTLSLLSDQDTGDLFTIATTTHGATRITTVDDDATAAHLTLDADGNINLDAANIGTVQFLNTGTTYADFSVHHSASYLRMYENGGASTDDYFDIAVGPNGATTFHTLDNAAAAAHFEIIADGNIDLTSVGNITLDATGDIALECGGADLTCDADNYTFSSANADDPLFIIQNATDDATGARLRLNKNRGADGQDGDECGELQFTSFDDGTPSAQTYAKIRGSIHDATSDEESGKLTISVASHDGGINNGIAMTGGSVDTEVDVTVGTGTSSVTTIAGTLTMGSTAALTNAGLVAVANQSNITGVGTITFRFYDK